MSARAPSLINSPPLLLVKEEGGRVVLCFSVTLCRWQEERETDLKDKDRKKKKKRKKRRKKNKKRRNKRGSVVSPSVTSPVYNSLVPLAQQYVPG